MGGEGGGLQVLRSKSAPFNEKQRDVQVRLLDSEKMFGTAHRKSSSSRSALCLKQTRPKNFLSSSTEANC